MTRPNYYFCDIPGSDMRGSFPRSLWRRGDWWWWWCWWCWCGGEEGVVGGGRDPEDGVMSPTLARGSGGRWRRWQGAEGGIGESDNWGHLLNKYQNETVFILVLQGPSGYIYTPNISVGSTSSNLMLTYHILHVESVRVSGCNFSVSYSEILSV